MARPRIATSIMEARGSFRDQRGRREKRALEPKVAKPFPSEPFKQSQLLPKEVEAWLEIAEHAPLGVLTLADPYLVDIAAILLVQQRERTISSTDRNTLIKILRELGMTPAGRASVQISVPVEDQASGFAQTG